MERSTGIVGAVLVAALRSCPVEIGAVVATILLGLASQKIAG